MVDKVFATISMLGVVVFMGIVTVGVMEPDLWIVALVILGIGVYDFVTALRDSGRKAGDS